MIRIRKLQEKDIPYMIEWMSDEELTHFLKADFKKYANEESQKKFIRNSFSNTERNFAIVDDTNDEYLGSISLKDIDFSKGEAEYAICIRRGAQGKSVATLATHQILMYAFQELGLNRIYLYVQTENLRANGFYNKYGFTFDYKRKGEMEIKGEKKDINWYSMTRDGFFSLYKNQEKEMTNVRKKVLNVITDNRGELIALEENPKQLDFPLERIYYMYNVGEQIVRGKHSHYDLEQLLVCVSGCVSVATRTPFEEQEYILSSPNEGLYIGPMIWREMHHFSKDAVLLVLASHKFDADDYIRDYDQYSKEAEQYFVKRMK